MNNTIDIKTLAALAQGHGKTAKAPTATQEKETAKEPEVQGRVFFGEFSVFENFMTPTGKVLTFYKGFAVIDDPELIEFAKTLRGVKEITGTVKVSELPSPPIRKRSRNWAASASDPTVFNPLDLLQRAVASSARLPQAAASNSTN
jgi:hypothetical protein